MVMTYPGMRRTTGTGSGLYAQPQHARNVRRTERMRLEREILGDAVLGRCERRLNVGHCLT